MHNTIPGHWNRVAYYSQHWFELIRKLGVPISRGDEETLPWKAQERRDADPCLQPRVRVCASVWCESGWGGRGAVSLAAVSVLMERERERGGLQDPVCQQPACERHCRAEVHHWQMSKSPPPLPPLLPLSLPGLSSSFVSEHREHRGPLRQPLENTYGAVVVKAAVLPLC